MADQSASGHAFLSYVHEDGTNIDQLCKVLKAANIPHWRDRADLGPGDMWKAKIKEAISSDSLAFLACFSKNSVEKAKSYQNEEITLAAEEFRLRPPGRTWLIPVRFDDCEVPEWDLGGGCTLRDINYIDLFGDQYTENVVKLIEATKKVMGIGGDDSAAVRTVVNEAAADERPALLRRLTKDMIRVPAREIELDELVSQEISTMLAGMRDRDRFPLILPGEDHDQHLLGIAEIAIDYRRLVEPFCASLQVAARWGMPESIAPWIKGIRGVSAEGMKMEGGWDALAVLRRLPALLMVTVAAVASSGQNRWDNFRALLVDNTIPDPRKQGARLPIIESVNPYTPFVGAAEAVAQAALANSVMFGTDLASAFAEQQRRHTPVSDWVFAILRPLFEEQFPDAAEYEDAFDRAEIALGVVTQDLANVRNDGSGLMQYFSNKWMGRSTWRYANRRCDPVKAFDIERELDGLQWKPLTAGLFGGSEDRARTAIDQYDEGFKEVSSGRW